eukprot:CAMPEP_0206412632 /NCGR_PEP_ID=MMETSP0294-20121207/34141_1 /ASSEMBLY_ACC=CAM_ASM_000327 /TAXON_ID=39354 /ORGANISM="Heterosigma akashiwo, Strain CCMP2393" /LENGTH=743 /DNA_ID=CAMNT_0053873881 /DNA_START=121 /DNA_END=2348 /DNA_ORIENTATION=+
MEESGNQTLENMLKTCLVCYKVVNRKFKAEGKGPDKDQRYPQIPVSAEIAAACELPLQEAVAAGLKCHKGCLNKKIDHLSKLPTMAMLRAHLSQQSVPGVQPANTTEQAFTAASPPPQANQSTTQDSPCPGQACKVQVLEDIPAQCGGDTSKAVKVLRDCDTQYTVTIDPGASAKDLDEYEKEKLSKVQYDVAKVLGGGKFPDIMNFRNTSKGHGRARVYFSAPRQYKTKAKYENDASKSKKRRCNTQRVKRAAEFVKHQIGADQATRAFVFGTAGKITKKHLAQACEGVMLFKTMDAMDELAMWKSTRCSHDAIRFIRRALLAHGVDIFLPYARHTELKKSICRNQKFILSRLELFNLPKGTKFDEREMTLYYYSGNLEERPHPPSGQKIKAPFLLAQNFADVIANNVLDKDRNSTYVRKPFQDFNTYNFLLGGDAGGGSFKFGVLNAHVDKGNKGSLVDILMMFQDAKDHYWNMHLAFKDHAGPSVNRLLHSNVLRLRNTKTGKFAAAVVPVDNPTLLPVPFAVFQDANTEKIFDDMQAAKATAEPVDFNSHLDLKKMDVASVIVARRGEGGAFFSTSVMTLQLCGDQPVPWHKISEFIFLNGSSPQRKIGVVPSCSFLVISCHGAKGSESFTISSNDGLNAKALKFKHIATTPLVGDKFELFRDPAPPVPHPLAAADGRGALPPAAGVGQPSAHVHATPPLAAADGRGAPPPPAGGVGQPSVHVHATPPLAAADGRGALP